MAQVQTCDCLSAKERVTPYMCANNRLSILKNLRVVMTNLLDGPPSITRNQMLHLNMQYALHVIHYNINRHEICPQFKIVIHIDKYMRSPIYKLQEQHKDIQYILNSCSDSSYLKLIPGLTNNT